MLSAAARNQPWDEPVPEIGYTEYANRKVIETQKYLEEHKIKERVAVKTEKAVTSVKSMTKNLWAKAKTLTMKKQKSTE